MSEQMTKLLQFVFAQVLMNNKDNPEWSTRQFVETCYDFMKGGYRGKKLLDIIEQMIMNQN